jgi:hypothetical protein
LRFRVTPKGGSQTTHHRLLYPHIAAGALNVVAVAALIAVPFRAGLDMGTEIAACACAAIVASVYAVAVMRLWRRVYRRNHYRVKVSMPATAAVAGNIGPCFTEDISFGGASLLLDRAAEPGSDLILSLFKPDPVVVHATVMSCLPAGEGRHRVGIRFAPLRSQDEQRLLFTVLGAVVGRELRGQERYGAAMPVAA